MSKPNLLLVPGPNLLSQAGGIDPNTDAVVAFDSLGTLLYCAPGLATAPFSAGRMPPRLRAIMAAKDYAGISQNAARFVKLVKEAKGQ